VVKIFAFLDLDSLWINPKNGVIEAVPRHGEIKEPLAKKILKNLDAE